MDDDTDDIGRDDTDDIGQAVATIVSVTDEVCGITIPALLQQSSDKERKLIIFDGLLHSGRLTPEFLNPGGALTLNCSIASGQTALHTSSVKY